MNALLMVMTQMHTAPVIGEMSPPDFPTTPVQNRNDSPMTLTLGLWSIGGPTGFAWVDAGPIVIGPWATAVLEVTWLGNPNTTADATATVGWSVAGGGSGEVTAIAHHVAEGP